MQNNLETLRLAISLMERQRIHRREEIRAALKAVALPVPQNIIDDLAQIPYKEALDVLRDHPGFRAWQRWKSYRAALTIFQKSIHDLMSSINDFKAKVMNDRLLEFRNINYKQEMILNVYKELFTVGNAAHSLKDHASYRVNKIFNFKDYENMLNMYFGDDGLHDFLMGIRNISHHVYMIQPGYMVRNSFEKGDGEVKFQFNRDDILFIIDMVKIDSRTHNFTRKGREYIERSPENIDVCSVYKTYADRADGFHQWLISCVSHHESIEFRDFERCMREIDNNSLRSSWVFFLRILLQKKINPINPYDYLDQYLTEEQISGIGKFPKKSRSQIDKIIEYVDVDGVCDQSIRELVYEIFRRSPD